MKDLHHERIDLLKMNIEGAEHAVLRSLLDAGLVVKVLCVEFDHPTSVLTIVRTIRQVLRGGYVAVSASHWNYTFIHRSVLP